MRPNRKERAQTLVEFALAFPIFLMLLLGIMEVGRAVLIDILVNTAAREGARYGAAAGSGTGGVPRYRDCAGIQNAAMRMLNLTGIENPVVNITYDNGNSATPYPGSCPRTIAGGERIVVRVTGGFRTVIPMVGLPDFEVSSTSRRTIIKDVEIK